MSRGVIDEGVISSTYDTPTMSLIADGALVDDDVNECDVDNIEDAGYGWILNAEVTVGTTYPFYAEFFLPGDSAAGPDVVAVGQPPAARPSIAADSPRLHGHTLNHLREYTQGLNSKSRVSIVLSIGS